MLLVSTSVFGYGIDGTKDSANFSNQMGPYPAYESWSYEGGTVSAPFADNLSGNTNSMSSYDSESTYYSSDGDIMTHSAADIGSTGWYKPFNSEYYIPSGTGGFTVEWRMKVNSMSGSDGLFMQFDCDEARQSYMRLKNDNTITAGGITAAVADISQWHTYRIAVLGEDTGDPGVVKANIYQDTDLIIEEFDAGIVGEASPSDYLWAQVEWDSQLGAYAIETDYIRIDATGTYAPYVEGEYTLSVYTVGNGTVALDPDQTIYLQDDVVELTATADPCWTFDYRSGDLSTSTNPDTIVITGNTAVTAHFTSVNPRPLLGLAATVGAYYFEGWYHDTPEAIAAFANAELRNDFPEREPIWGGGLWRGDTVEIMEQQIDLAADHGIAFFSFDWYWYGSPSATANDGINSGLKNFMLASNRNRMKFNINICDAGPTTIDSDTEWQQVADMLLPYLMDSQYLRVGGNPLITNFNAAGMTQTNYNYFQQIAVAAGISEVQFAANVAGPASRYTNVTRYNAVPGWDAGETAMPYKNLAYYIDGIRPRPGETWADPGIWNTDSDGMDAAQSYIPTVMAGWDARPWNTPASWYFNNTTYMIDGQNWGRTPETFAAHLQAAIDWIDDNPILATPERLVMIYAWNEFGEGGYITPTLGDPDGLYLDAIKSVLVPEADIAPDGGDGSVDFFDWAVFANAWQGTSSPLSANWNPKCDIAPAGGNGIIDIDDLVILVNQWLWFE